jgi:hypothetical protein
MIRTEYAYTKLPDSFFDRDIGAERELKIKVVSPIDVRENSARFIAEPILDHTPHLRVPYIRVTLPRVNSIKYGDELILQGTIVSVMTNNSKRGFV